MKPRTLIILGLIVIALSFFAGIMLIYPKLLKARREAALNIGALDSLKVRNARLVKDSVRLVQEKKNLIVHRFAFEDSVNAANERGERVKVVIRYIHEVHPKNYYDSVWSKRFNYK